MSFRLFISIGLALSAISGDARADLEAGAAAVKINPGIGVPMDGAISQNPPVKAIHDDLHARCLVLGDGGTRLAFVIVDNTMISRELIDRAKAGIEERTGIPPSHVCVAATHTHSTPRGVIGMVDDESHRDYLETLVTRIVEAAVGAAGRMRSATLGWGSFQEPRFVHNRRWVLAEDLRAMNVNPFGERGEIVKMNPGREGLLNPAGPVDAEVFVLSLREKESGAPLAVLSAYGLHYVGGVPAGEVSADYYGVYARRLKEALNAEGFVGMMANGTSGDINANDLTRPRESFEPYERMTHVGGELARQTVGIVSGIDHPEVAPILAAATTELELRVRKPDEKRRAWAEEMLAKAEPGKRLSRGQVYARETRHLAGYPDTVSLPIQVFRIGELAVAQLPCEVFAETGLAIKADSPFAGSTFTIELANGYFGYLPTAKQFEWGGYETWPARSSLLEIEAEAKIRAAVGDLMRRLRAGPNPWRRPCDGVAAEFAWAYVGEVS